MFSVFLLLILSAVLMFHGVLIDFVRIKLLKTHTEQAVKSAVRSTLAAYDSSLQKYGLYGLALAEEQRNELFVRILEENLSLKDNQGVFRYVSPRLNREKAAMSHVQTLGSHSVLKWQILEEMKYRAPVEWTLGLVDKLKNHKEVLADTGQFAKNAEAVQKWIDLREQKMDRAWQGLNGLYRTVENGYSRFASDLMKLEQLREKIGLNDLESVKRSLETLKKNLEDLKERRDVLSSAQGAAEELSRIHASIQSLREKIEEKEELLELILEYGVLAEEVKNRASLMDGEISDAIKKIELDLNEAQKTDQRLKEELERIWRDDGHGSAGFKELSGKHADPNEVFRYVEILGYAYFDSYRADVGKIGALFSGFKNVLDARLLQSTEGLTEANETYYDFARQVIFRRGQEKNKREIMRNERQEDQKKAQQQAEGNWKKFKSDIQTLTSVCSSEQRLHYGKLAGKEGLENYYLNYNRTLPDAPAPIADLEKDSEHLRKKMFDWMDILFETMENLRDDIFINEYALTYFNYRTYRLDERDPRNLTAASEPHTHALFNQEAEYILYGFSQCEGNLLAAYGELYLLRLAIRTAEQLLQPKHVTKGHPLIVLLTAVAEASSQAYDDTRRLTAGEEVELVSGSSVRLNYKDYLRIFFLLHGGQTGKLARMQALIHLNTGIDLTDRPTYILGMAEASVKLWFLPGILKTLNKTDWLDGKVEGAFYTIRKQAAMSY